MFPAAARPRHLATVAAIIGLLGSLLTVLTAPVQAVGPMTSAAPRSFAPGVTCSATVSTYTQLQTAVTSSVDGTVICINESMTMDDSIVIDDTTLMLVGRDDSAVTLTASPSERHILVTSPTAADDTLSVSRLTFKGGDDTTAVHGGIQVNDPDARYAVSVDHSTFVHNVTNGPNGGGAIRSTGPVAVGDSEFTRNEATNSSGGQGGAISADRSLTATDTDFEFNVGRGEYGGGAVYSARQVRTLRGSFVGNETPNATINVSGGGGAVFADDTITVDGTSLIDNAAPQGVGGALRSAKAVLASNSTFYSNAAKDHGAIYGRNVVSLAFVSAVDDTSSASAVYAQDSLTLIGTSIAPAIGGGSVCSMAASGTSSRSYVTDSSCGAGDGTLLGNTLRSALGFDDALVTDDSTGAQVLIPDDTSVLVNAAPDNLVSGVTIDQLQATRGRAPDDSTTVGAVQVLPLLVTSQPSSTSVMTGSSATFTVAGLPGVGTSLAYQWQTSTNGGTTWTNELGATAPTLTLPSVTASQDGLRVRAQISDIRDQPLTSQVATLTVTPSPSFPPGAPREVNATAGDRQATITWAVPASTGSFPITHYEVTSDTGDHTCTSSTSLTCTITGLTNGTDYRFRARALNGAGWSTWSEWTDTITPQPSPVASILITGYRDGGTVHADGITSHLQAAEVTTRVKLRGQKTYKAGLPRPIAADGTFAWQRKTGKKVYIYFTADGIRSNGLTISARS